MAQTTLIDPDCFINTSISIPIQGLCASGLTCSTTNTAGTNTSNHKIGL
jgi:hypothetical protein